MHWLLMTWVRGYVGSGYHVLTREMAAKLKLYCREKF